MPNKNVIEYILDVSTSAATKGMKAFSSSVGVAKKGLAALKNVSVAVAGVSIAFAGAVGVAVKEVTDLVNELNDLSVRSGVATETIAALRFSMVASGQSAEGLNEILGAISGQFAQLSTEGSAVEKKFKSFGIAVKDASGNVRSNNEILLDGIKKLQQIGNVSKRSRVAITLFGEAGAKLNQALAAGDFEKFVELTTRFGVRAGPEASKKAAELQVNISLLNSILAGTTQRFTEAIGGSERFIQILQVMSAVMGGVNQIIERNSVFLGHLTDAIFEAGAAAIDFFAGFLTGTKSAAKGIEGLVQNIFIVGQAILRGLLVPLQAFIYAARVMSEFLDLEMTSSLKNLEKRLQELNRGLNINASEGFVNFAEFSSAATDVLTIFNSTTTESTKKTKDFNVALEDTSTAIKEVEKNIRTSTDVINDFLSSFVRVDIIGIMRDLKILSFDVGFAFFKLRQTINSLEADSLASKLKKSLGKMAIKVDDVFNNAFFRGLKNKFGDVLKAGSEGGLARAFQALGKGGKIAGIFGAAIFGAIKIAEGLGERGSTVKEVQKSVEEDIRARAKAIELGLRALPRILFETLPPLLVEFADRIIFGFFKAMAESTNQILSFFRSILTREGRQEIRRERGGRTIERVAEFNRRLDVLFGIVSKRGGGPYIPSARGGIKFTGADEGLAMLHRGEYVVPETGQMPQAVQRTMGMGQGGMTININAAVVESNAIDELVRQIERRFQTFGSSTSPLFGGR